MKFYLGTHETGAQWWNAGVPLFVSRRRLVKRRTFARATVPWALDSGGFTELNLHGYWELSPQEYAAEVLLFQREIGLMEWCAPQDWMCEPFVIAKTGLTIGEHQWRTVENYLHLRELLGGLVIPVLQGWEWHDYHLHWDMYEQAGVDLASCPTVGLGTICRRQNMTEAGRIVRSLRPLRLHAFGVKLTGLESFGDALASADSMAWSYAARKDHPIRGHTHKSCANCIEYALRWSTQITNLLGQTRLEVTCATSPPVT